MSHHDAIDHRILKELGSPQVFQWNIRESYSKIARRVGVDEETVRKRIKRAEKMGVIQGWILAVNPSLIGCEDVYMDLEVGVPDRKAAILSQLKLIDGVTTILDFEGNGLFLAFYSEPGEPLERKCQLIGQICETDRLNVWSGVLPSSNHPPSETDWRIIWAMRNEPRMSLAEIAKVAKVSNRTVNRRLSLLTEQKAFFLMGLPNFKATPGVIGNFLASTIEGKASSVAGEVSSKFETIAFGGPVSRTSLMYNIAFQNLSEADEARKWIGSLKGVERVRMGIVREMIVSPGWLEGEMRRRAYPK